MRGPGKIGRCSACGECAGHYRPTCPTNPPPPKSTRRTDSPSQQAAFLAEREGISLRAAASRIGVSPQSASQAWRRLFPGRRAPTSRWRESLPALHAEGLTAAQMSERVGHSRSVVYTALHALGLEPHPDRGYPAERWTAALAAIRAGASAAEAAADHGVSPARLTERARESGQPSRVPGGGRKDGRTKRAWARIAAGERVVDAARAERCAPTSLYAMAKIARSA